MYNIYCLQGFNNYYNRIVKKFNSITEYRLYQESNEKEFISIPNINFVPNDCVNTSQIINWSYGWLPDYIITEDEDTGQIMRWFVIESIRQRGKQYLFQLRRDLIVDFYDSIIDAPCFIEKANLTYENPLIFNSEDITVNQIKTSEKLIKDMSDCPWIVGYYSKGTTLTGTVDVNADPEAISVNANQIESWDFYSYVNTPLVGPEIFGQYLFNYADGPALSPVFFRVEVNSTTGDAKMTIIDKTTVQLQNIGLLLETDFENAFVNYGLSKLDHNSISNAKSQETVDQLLSFNGKLIKTLDGKYYKIRVSSRQETVEQPITAGGVFNNLSTVVKNMGLIGTPNNSTFKYKFKSTFYTLTIIEETSKSTKYNIGTDKIITVDAPWDIFAIPYGEVSIVSGTTELFKTSKDYAIATATAIQQQNQSKVFDIQLVPYCPVQNLIIDKGKMILEDTKDYSFITDPDNTNIGVIFNVPKSTFDFSITSTTWASGKTAIERKINFECEKFRLTSPNFSNYFDFSVEKNDGVPGFNVDINYKPYTPYIHINPIFGGLYGYDDNSPRGLVLGGDFSLSAIIDQWQQYQIQNKNFQNIFDRQIQNLDINQSVQRTQDIFRAITGTVTGATSGAFVGSMMGSAPIGAVVGGLASGIGGLADITLNEKLRNEALDYTVDMFGYQLGNIQALPNTISKVSALNNNNKLFPVLEYYTCKNTEKIAVLNKLAYNGMTVMMIGKIKDYLGNSWSYTIENELTNETITITSKNYIKGRLIKIEDINCDDFHVANEIASEVFKGVYL